MIKLVASSHRTDGPRSACRASVGVSMIMPCFLCTICSESPVAQKPCGRLQYAAPELVPKMAPNFSHKDRLLSLLGQASRMESCMRTVLLVASLFAVLSSSASIARPSLQIAECSVIMPCDFSGPQLHHGRYQRQQIGVERRATSYRNAMAMVDSSHGQVVGGRPAGCPHSFCGCGASIRLFGRIVPG